MVILGIDAGNIRMGLASIIDEKDELCVDYSTVIHHPNTNSLPFNQYLNQGIHLLCEEFPQVLHLTRPNLIVAEIVPVGRLGSNSELNVAAITVCKVIAWQWGITWIDMASQTAKKAVTGDGRANKTKVRNTVIQKFPEVGKEHQELKKEQKALGNKPQGLPQDLFDSIAISWAGHILYGKTKEKAETGNT